MKLATWNVNSINARLERVVEWFKEAEPDVACLQEIKCVDEKFPIEAFESLGYNVAVHGQKSYNGVALLSRFLLEDVRRGLPLLDAADEPDEQSRYIEAVIGSPRPVRVAGIYLPNGNPIGTDKFTYKLAWMERLRHHAIALRAYEEPLLLMGDFNVIPTPQDCDNPPSWMGDALFQPESRQAFRALPLRRLHRRPGAGGDGAARIHLLGLPGGRLAAKPRHPHRLRPPLSRGRRPVAGVRGAQARAGAGEAVGPYAGGRHPRRLTRLTNRGWAP